MPSLKVFDYIASSSEIRSRHLPTFSALTVLNCFPSKLPDQKQSKVDGVDFSLFSMPTKSQISVIYGSVTKSSNKMTIQDLVPAGHPKHIVEKIDGSLIASNVFCRHLVFVSFPNQRLKAQLSLGSREGINLALGYQFAIS